ncbi:MAG: hypothetical protein C0483_18545 [Pirellula sp.]|nr:hypothetical protein [Pirellula sp.]
MRGIAMRGPDDFGGGGGKPFFCTLCFVPLTPALAFAMDPDGVMVPYLQAVDAYAELPPPKVPLDPKDPRDWIAISSREADPICRRCAKEFVNE